MPQQFVERRFCPRLDLPLAHRVQTEDGRAAVALRCEAAARVIDQYPPHHLRDQMQKVRAVGPFDRRAVHQAQQGFVHERRALQRVVAPLAPQVAARVCLQFRIDDRGELAEGALIPLLPPHQHLRDGSRRGGVCRNRVALRPGFVLRHNSSHCMPT